MIPAEKKKPKFTLPKLCKCQNPECPYYKKRHRRYYWFSKTKLAKPSCPKCFSHNTAIVTSEEAKELGL